MKMKKQKHHFFMLFIVLITNCAISGQDKVVLKRSGSVIEGEIVQLQYGGNVVLNLPTGTQAVIPTNQIKQVFDDGELIYGNGEKVQEVYESNAGHWSAIWENKLMANADFGGVGLTVGALYHWRSQVMFGGGLGYDNYNFKQDRAMIPIFLQGRAYLRDWATTPYIDFKTGYSIGLLPKDTNVTSHSGGTFFHGGAGIKFGRNFGTTVGLGILFQNAYHKLIIPWNNGMSQEERVYKRMTLNLGFIF